MAQQIDDLRAIAADQSELEEVFQQYFGHAQALNEREIRVGFASITDTEYCASLHYNRDGGLIEIRRGPTLSDLDVVALRARIEKDLLQPPMIRVGRTVMFAHVPVNDFFTYKDVFQITPAPPEAPRSVGLFGPHPFVLEFRYPGASEFPLDQSRRMRSFRELELLLAALIPTVATLPSRSLQFHWVLRSDNPQTPAEFHSEYLQCGYRIPGFRPNADAFASQGSATSMVRVPIETYYQRLGVASDALLDVPDRFEQLLDAYYVLDRHEKDRFLRAAFWIQHAQHVHALSESAVFMALVNAVEALIPSGEPGAIRCRECKRDVGPGPTEKFKQFVDHYAPSATAKNRKSLYSLRSQITHGGRLLHGDRNAWGMTFTGRKISDWASADEIRGIARVVLINWLAKP